MRKYECFHCGCKTVIWESESKFEDEGLEGEGIVRTYYCETCGAEITYEIPDEE